MMRSRARVWTVMWLAVVASGVAHAAAPPPPPSSRTPIADLVRRNQFEQPRLSPDGKHLAVLVRREEEGRDTTEMAIYEVAGVKPVSVLRLRVYEVPLGMYWVSNTRLVVDKGFEYGSLDMPASSGELLATDFDGRHIDYLYGYQRAEVKRGSMPEDRGFGVFSGTPDAPNGHFYLTERPWERNGESLLYDVDASNGNRTPLGRVDLQGATFLVDHAGHPRYAVGADDDNRPTVLFRRPDRSGWERLGDEKTAPYQPLSFAPDDQSVYAWIDEAGAPRALEQVSLADGQRRRLASDATGDIDFVQWQSHPPRPFAAATGVGVPQPRYLPGGEDMAAVHRALSAKLPGDFLMLESASQDGNLLVFQAASDRNPGAYYLHDRSTGSTRRLFVKAPWIDPARMPSRVPIDFQARDGLALHGYLTLPPDRDPKNLPMILLPHGGPHGIADGWFYDADAAFLAGLGYAVLQVNYRGSGGRGDKFLEAGYREWGQRIQQDLIDGVRWAIAEEVADPSRICTYGGSFGGYAALMAVVRAPELFKCAVGYAGIYDLAMMYRKGDIAAQAFGRNYLGRALGRDAEVLALNSPAQLAAQINVPVFLAHGEEDQRAPFAQAEAMRDALVKTGHRPEWMAVPKEGHGFYAERNRAAFYARLQAFLARSLSAVPSP